MEFGIPELTEEQFEEVTQTAENAARKLVFSRVNQKLVEKLDVSVEAEGTKPVNFLVEVDIGLSKFVEDVNVEALAQDAVNEAFRAIEDYLRRLL